MTSEDIKHQLIIIIITDREIINLTTTTTHTSMRVSISALLRTLPNHPTLTTSDTQRHKLNRTQFQRFNNSTYPVFDHSNCRRVRESGKCLNSVHNHRVKHSILVHFFLSRQLEIGFRLLPRKQLNTARGWHNHAHSLCLNDRVVFAVFSIGKCHSSEDHDRGFFATFACFAARSSRVHCLTVLRWE